MSDTVETKCLACQGTNGNFPTLLRKSLRVDLNGPGKQFENARPVAGDVIECAFRLNGGSWARITGNYTVSQSAADGNYLHCYNIFKVGEEPVLADE